MTAWRPAGFWAAALLALIVFLLVFSEILLPFVVGMILAYAVDPIADRFERLGMSRLGATLTIFVLLVVVVALGLILVVPILANQIADFIEDMPSYVEKLHTLFTSFLENGVTGFLGIDMPKVSSYLGGVSSQGASWLATVLSSLWSGGRAVLNIASLLVVTPVVAFYLLYDWDRLVVYVDSLLPRDHVDEIRLIARDIDSAIAAFIRGQGLVSLTMAAFYSIGLVSIGLNFGFLIGLVAGLLGFIPFVGALIGFTLSLGVALVQFWPDWIWILATLSIFLLGQFLESNVLQPRLIGKNVGLHPVWVMFALFAFGLLFGFVGIMIAIPAAAAVGVLVRYGTKRYLASPIYRGEGSP
jgi:predicted PurR-regulated permease PerM